MENYKEYFKNKKVIIMGLGLLGRGIGVAKFLAKHGAELLITDLKTKQQLTSSVKQLKKFKNIKYILGQHRLEDFYQADILIKAAGIPLDSIYLAEALKWMLLCLRNLLMQKLLALLARAENQRLQN